MFGDTYKTADDVIKSRLEPWLNRIPDFFDVEQAYTELGTLKSKEIKLKWQIEEAEDTVIQESDRPRSNDTKKAKLHATNKLRAELSEIQSKLAETEQKVKLLEYRKTMFTSAIYRTKVQYEL